MTGPITIEATFDGKVFVPTGDLSTIPVGQKMSLTFLPTKRLRGVEALMSLADTLTPVPGFDPDKFDRGDLYP